HLGVTSTTRQGDRVHLEGLVVASNTPAQVGRPFAVDGVVQQDFTSLALSLDDGTFTGKGVFVSAPKFTEPIHNFKRSAASPSIDLLPFVGCSSRSCPTSAPAASQLSPREASLDDQRLRHASPPGVQSVPGSSTLASLAGWPREQISC